MKFCLRLLCALTVVLSLAGSPAGAVDWSDPFGRQCLIHQFFASTWADDPILEARITGLLPKVQERFVKQFRKDGFVPAADAGVNEDYEAGWRRDGALSSQARLDMIERGEIKMTPAELKNMIVRRIHYIRNTLRSDRENGLNPSEPRHDSRGRVPMVERNGQRIPQPWAREQADGAALIGSEFARMSQILLDQDKIDWVERELFDDAPPPNHRGLLKIFIEHITHEGLSHELDFWRGAEQKKAAMTSDLWEEMFGHHFYTAMMQIQGIRDTNALLYRLASMEDARGNSKLATDYRKTAEFYASQADRLRKAIEDHWIEDKDGKIYIARLRKVAGKLREVGKTDEAEKMEARAAEIEKDPDKNFPKEQRTYFAATLYPEPARTYHFEKVLQQDPAVVLSMIQTYRVKRRPIVAVSNSKTLATVHAFESLSQQVYPKKAQIWGVSPITRYLGDYWQGKNKGEIPAETRERTDLYAWTLLTEGYATFHYLLRTELSDAGEIRIDDTNLEFFRALARQGLDVSTLKPGKVIRRGDTLFEPVLAAIHRKGDAYLKIALQNYDAEGNNSEGFDPVTRDRRGPPNLAWNTVELMRALWARGLTSLR